MGRGHQTHTRLKLVYRIIRFCGTTPYRIARGGFLLLLYFQPFFFRYLSASSRLAPNTAGAVAESLVIITDRYPNTEVKSSIKAMKKSTGAASIVKMFSCL